MVYGIFSEKDTQISFLYMQSKKVSRETCVNICNIKQLITRLHIGDVVHVVSVDRFPSVCSFVEFARIVLNVGASIRILEQPYLDVGNGKHYKPSVQKHLRTLCTIENVSYSRLCSALKLDSNGKQYIYKCVTDITIGVLATTYATDGIMRR